MRFSPRLGRLGAWLVVFAISPASVRAQTLPPLEPPTLAVPGPITSSALEEPAGANAIEAPIPDAILPPSTALPEIPALPPTDDRVIRPVTSGPLHEAFLSPAKDRDPVYVDQAPPPPINERPGVDPPNDSAVWIPGYWEWDGTRKDYLWTT